MARNAQGTGAALLPSSWCSVGSTVTRVVSCEDGSRPHVDRHPGSAGINAWSPGLGVRFGFRALVEPAGIEPATSSMPRKRAAAAPRPLRSD